MRSLLLFGTAIATIFGGSVWAVGETPLPKPEPVSFVSKIEAQCPDQKFLPRINVQSPCVQQVVAQH